MKELMRTLMTRIKETARNGQTHCNFTVPAMIRGLPLYDPRVMRNTLVTTMKERGWRAVPVASQSLDVAWDRASSTPRKNTNVTAVVVSSTTQAKVARALARCGKK
jgi:hypothetical protein